MPGVVRSVQLVCTADAAGERLTLPHQRKSTTGTRHAVLSFSLADNLHSFPLAPGGAKRAGHGEVMQPKPARLLHPSLSLHMLLCSQSDGKPLQARIFS